MIWGVEFQGRSDLMLKQLYRRQKNFKTMISEDMDQPKLDTELDQECRQILISLN